jgi:hypothetical protein
MWLSIPLLACALICAVPAMYHGAMTIIPYFLPGSGTDYVGRSMRSLKWSIPAMLFFIGCVIAYVNHL